MHSQPPLSDHDFVHQPPNPELALLPDLFLLYPKNRAFIDGKSQTITNDLPSRKTLLVITILIAVLVLLGLIFVGPIWANYQDLQSNGETTQATVIRRIPSCDDDGCTYNITYTYVVDNWQYSVDQGVSQLRYDQLTEGSLVEVIYHPENPSNVSLKSGSSPTNSTVLGVIVLIIFLGIVPVLKVMVKRRALHHLSKGILLSGKVMRYRFEKKNGGEGEDYYIIYLNYAFETPNQLMCSGQAKFSLGETVFMNALPIVPGTTVAVMYLNDDRHQLL
jgi:hypothetical protein